MAAVNDTLGSPPVMVVGGSPGCGKTSVSRLLALGDPMGVHIESDHFFDFLAHKIDPSMPAARTQNETVVQSYGAAARAYAMGGYAVYLDGVIGPWMLPLLTPILGEIDYVLLHAAEAVTLDRLKSRKGQASARPSVALRMYKQFAAIVGEYQRHVVRTDGRDLDAILDEIHARRGQGDFRLLT